MVELPLGMWMLGGLMLGMWNLQSPDTESETAWKALPVES